MASTRTRGRRATEFRAEMKALWEPLNAACRICGQATIDWDGPANASQSFELHHLRSVRDHPELEFDPLNAAPSHSICNRNLGANDVRAGLGETTEAW